MNKLLYRLLSRSAEIGHFKERRSGVFMFHNNVYRDMLTPKVALLDGYMDLRSDGVWAAISIPRDLREVLVSDWLGY